VQAIDVASVTATVEPAKARQCEHVLVDGHHRVSVARDQGLRVIDARVVELRPRHGR
jgi:hypothetical protein